MSVAQYGFNDREDLSYLGPKRTKMILHRFALDSNLNNFGDRFDHYHHLTEWATSDKGKWCCENATEMTLHKQMDASSLMMHYLITGMLTEKQLTFFTIKFS
jgi:hypothetical protein